MSRMESPCERIRDLLLEADMPELDGTGDTEVARHVRSCPACHRIAERILAETAALDRWLDRPGRELDVEAILARAGLEPADGRGTEPSRFRGARWALPLTAAAALALLFLVEQPRPPLGPPPPQTASSEQGLDLEVAGATTAAVFETDNPDITVVWFMQGDDR